MYKWLIRKMMPTEKTPEPIGTSQDSKIDSLFIKAFFKIVYNVKYISTKVNCIS